MRKYLNIKGKNVWKVCALLAIAIIISCCGTEISEFDQPATATVNKPITITIQTQYCVAAANSGKLIVALLLPTGWQGKSNMTMTYANTAVGNGVLKPVDASAIEPQSKLPWATACLNKFGIENNYINDMEWVVFISDNAYAFQTVENAPVNITIILNPGADNNNANVNINYLIAEDHDGLEDPDPPGSPTYAYNNCSYPDPYEYFEVKSGPTLVLTGGAVGTLIDYAHPQLSTIIPSKALQNDLVTVTFFGDIDVTKLLNAPQVYFNATAYTTDNVAYPVNSISSKTEMQQTSATSNEYQLSLWPQDYFGIPSGKTLDRVEYLITDKTGQAVVGRDSTNSKFIYNFTCVDK